MLLELPSGRIVAGGSGAIAQPFMFSDDGGDTWAYLPVLPAAAADNSQKMCVRGSRVYFSSAFGAGPPFRDYFSDDGGATIQSITVNPPVGGGTTCVAVNQATGALVRGDPTGLFLANIGALIPPPPDVYTAVAAGGAFNSVDDMLHVPEFGEFVGVNNIAGLTCVRSATGAAATWVSAAHLGVGSFLHLRALHFGA
jgi:hypothetical protein